MKRWIVAAAAAGFLFGGLGALAAHAASRAPRRRGPRVTVGFQPHRDAWTGQVRGCCTLTSTGGVSLHLDALTGEVHPEPTR